jgi:DNA-binding MarR family transcriptional regulator
MSDTADTHDEQAVRTWTALYDYVNAQDRRRELQDALGLGGGFGRVKVLLHLERGPMTLRDIAEANGMDAPYATVICDKLAEKGLVRRTPHPDDNRRKLVTLTKGGHEMAQRARQILGEPPPSLSALPASDLAVLEEMMTRLSARDYETSKSAGGPSWGPSTGSKTSQ